MVGPLETAMIAGLLVALMFSMGTTLTTDRFRAVARDPRALLLGTLSQFGWMPLLAYALAKWLRLPNEAALGLIVMGSCPGGAMSNLFAHFARGDVALSIAMTGFSKVVGVVMMPLCLYIYARPFTDANMPIPYGEITKTLAVLLIPVAVGMAMRRRFGPQFAKRAERIGSALGVLLLVVLIVMTVVRNRHLLALATPTMYVAAVALGAAGMLVGLLSAKLWGLPPAQQRTVSFETGVQNPPLCVAILVAAFPPESHVDLLRVPVLYVLFVMSEAIIATLLYRRLDARPSATPLAAAGAGTEPAEIEPVET
jgi:BASS family bile acid:Na+ symporter